MKRTGFSLVELLVAVALMILLSIAFYGYWSKSYQERQKVVCLKNLQTIYMALRIYADENRQQYPFISRAQFAEQPLSLLIPRYTASTGIFICPGSRDSAIPEARSFAQLRISYAYYMGLTMNSPVTQPLLSDRQVDTTAKIHDQLTFSPDGKSPGNNHHQYGGCILFADGHAENSPIHSARDLPVPEGLTLLNPRP